MEPADRERVTGKQEVIPSQKSSSRRSSFFQKRGCRSKSDPRRQKCKIAVVLVSQKEVSVDRLISIYH
jgi:hypothetical protein